MQYFVRRLLISLPVLFAVTVLIFALINLAPGDPIDFFVNDEAGISREDLGALEKKFGLDSPVHLRYLQWVAGAARGDLGFRFKNGDDVAQVLAQRVGRTLVLIGAALAIAIVGGVTLGVFIGLRQYSFWDHSLTGLSFVGISMPAFIAGIFGLYVFSVKLGWFPSGGMHSVGVEPTLLDSLHHLVLPACTLAILELATFMRYTRFSVLEVKQADYIRTARAKGLRERLVTWRHTVRNAILPVVTMTGYRLPMLVAGALFTETIYSWPGMGSLFVDAVLVRDYPMVMGIMLVIAVAVILTNLLTDFVYGIVDPRIRYE
ncbi:MAG: ABC transporter permease [Gammaproteobacteria bacterium]